MRTALWRFCAKGSHRYKNCCFSVAKGACEARIGGTAKTNPLTATRHIYEVPRAARSDSLSFPARTRHRRVRDAGRHLARLRLCRGPCCLRAGLHGQVHLLHRRANGRERRVRLGQDARSACGLEARQHAGHCRQQRAHHRHERLHHRHGGQVGGVVLREHLPEREREAHHQVEPEKDDHVRGHRQGLGRQVEDQGDQDHLGRPDHQ